VLPHPGFFRPLAAFALEREPATAQSRYFPWDLPLREAAALRDDDRRFHSPPL
jgi:hypothetical protein